MPYLLPHEVDIGLADKGTSPSVRKALRGCGAIMRELGVDTDFDFLKGLVGDGVFCPDPEPPLIEDPQARQDAADIRKFHLVFYSDEKISMDVLSFDSFNKAKKQMDSLKPDEYGHGGGLLVHNREIMNGVENIFDRQNFKKYSKKKTRADYMDFYRRAAFYAVPKATDQRQQNADIICKQLVDRLDELASFAPAFRKMKSEYGLKSPSELPVVVYGRPSPPLAAFAQLCPHLVRLGGCSIPDPMIASEETAKALASVTAARRVGGSRTAKVRRRPSSSGKPTTDARPVGIEGAARDEAQIELDRRDLQIRIHRAARRSAGRHQHEKHHGALVSRMKAGARVRSTRTLRQPQSRSSSR